MGYYIKITKSTAIIPAGNLKRVYDIMCELNDHDELKHGSSYSGSKLVQKYFSWMTPDYPATCKDAFAILEMLGFNCCYDSKGNLCINYYDSKAGDEGVFLKSISDYVIGPITWMGEEGDVWETKFTGGDVIDVATTSHLLTHIVS